MCGYVYILQSEKSGRYYCGSSNDPHRRLLQHNANAVRATRSKGPWKRVGLVAFADLTEARRAERYIKAQKSRRAIESIIRGTFTWPAEHKPIA